MGEQAGGQRRLVAGLLLIATAAFLVPAAAAVAAPLRGVLDSSFGRDGRVVSNLGPGFVSSQLDALVRQPDGKLVLTGRVGRKNVVERRHPNGALDASFGDGGIVSPPRAPEIVGLAVDEGGRSLFAVPTGSPCGISTVRRLLPTGAPDQSFGSDGAGASVPMTVQHLALDGAGRTVLAGSAPTAECGKNPPPMETVLTRIGVDGSVDRSFGENGIVHLQEKSDEFGFTSGLSIREDGTILVAGSHRLLAYAPSGQLEPGFGAEGVAEVAGSVRTLIAVPGNGVLVTSSNSDSYFDYFDPCCRKAGDFAVSRYRSDGSLDPAFGSGGTARLDVDEVDNATALAASPDGSFVLAGGSGKAECPPGECPPTPILARFSAGGALDPSFGTGGVTRVQIPLEPRPYSFEPRLAGLAIAPTGQIVAAGGAGPYSDGFVIASDAGGRPDPGFGNGGAIAEVRTRPSGTRATGLAITTGGKILVSALSTVGDHTWRGAMLASKPNGGFAPEDGHEGAEGAGELWGASGRYAYSLRNGRIVRRFDAGGRLDRGYGSEGAATLPAGFRAIALDVGRKGRIVAVGRLANREGMAAVALRPDGLPDSRFGKEGVALVGFGGKSRTEARAVGVDSKDRVILFGRSGTRSIAARLTADGRLDPSFADRGRLRRLPFSGLSETGVVVQRDGKVLLAARPGGSRRPPLLILRMNPDGVVDRSFGRRGRIRIGSQAPGLSLFASRGQIVLVSPRWRGGAGGVALRAFEPDGDRDRDFGRRGVAFFGGSSPRYFRPVAAARQPDGRIVIAATRGRISSGADVQLLRFR